MPHSAGRSGKDFSHCLILMLVFACRYGGTKSRRGCSSLRGDQPFFLISLFLKDKIKQPAFPFILLNDIFLLL